MELFGGEWGGRGYGVWTGGGGTSRRMSVVVVVQLRGWRSAAGAGTGAAVVRRVSCGSRRRVAVRKRMVDQLSLGVSNGVV